MPTRHDRLDALLVATKDWAAKHRAQLNAQLVFSKRLLKGRTGSDHLVDSTQKKVEELLTEEITDFLNG